MEPVAADLIQRVVDIGRRCTDGIGAAQTGNADARNAVCSTAIARMVSELREIDSQNGSASGKALREAFRNEISDFSEASPLVSRATTKPNGYPGDYVLLDAVYRRTLAGDTPVGRSLDLAFLNAPLAETLRQRKESVVEILMQLTEQAEEPVRLLDLACGPCADVVDLLPPPTCTFVCVDHDQAAIDFAKTQIPPELQQCVSFLCANVLRLPEDAEQLQTPFDIVYSVGLLDYLADRLAHFCIRKWWQFVRPGGHMLLTVKDRDRYDPTFYDWVADWTFVPRTEESFRELIAASLGAQVPVRTFRDSTGVSVQAVIEEKS